MAHILRPTRHANDTHNMPPSSRYNSCSCIGTSGWDIIPRRFLAPPRLCEVDCLNAVLDTMSNWRVPSIMIPGNHDQIDYRGSEHALTPLSNAYRIKSSVPHNTELEKQYYAGPLILSHPTKFLDAFFIPHIRDKAMMKSILSSEAVAQSSALFVHADVKGASMNDLIKSRNVKDPRFGMWKSVSNLKFRGGSIQIITSCGFTKMWECIEEIPLDIGPRFHRLSSVNEFLGMSEEEINGVGVNKKLRSGDKVIVAVSQAI
ncbi:hypothetical protein QTG54_002153 [Skeletonema marinoi]|uniref:Uncharacterized protein n=1 Tax=Skeletonema marinoi TaxID=267567 RepID=A0AAD8YJR8_9STRA|nr:hypothetical protein QTG54_002153 [Skeletonema marinoi]